MGDDAGKTVFPWQLGLGVLVGLLWGLLWRFGGAPGFFVDLAWGLWVGFAWALIGVAVVGLVALGVWAAVRAVQVRRAGVVAGGIGGVLSQDLDRLSRAWAFSGASEGLDRFLASLRTNPVLWAVEWVLALLFAWGLAGGIALGADNTYFGGLLIFLLWGIVGGLVIAVLWDRLQGLFQGLTVSYGWMDRAVEVLGRLWDSWKLEEIFELPAIGERYGLVGVLNWAFAGAFVWGVVGGLAGGIGHHFGWGLAAFFGALFGGFAGIQLLAQTEFWYASQAYAATPEVEEESGDQEG